MIMFKRNLSSISISLLQHWVCIHAMRCTNINRLATVFVAVLQERHERICDPHKKRLNYLCDKQIFVKIF